MKSKEFDLLAKLFLRENLSDSDLQIFDKSLKNIKKSVESVTDLAVNNYLPTLKSTLNYKTEHEKVIADYLKKLIINSIYQESGLIFEYISNEIIVFRENLNKQIEELFYTQKFVSNIFIYFIYEKIKSEKEIDELRTETVELQKSNNKLLTMAEVGKLFLGKKISKENLALYKEIKTELESLREEKVISQSTSIKAAVRNVLRRKNKQVTGTSVTRLYKAFLVWYNNLPKELRK